MVSFSIEDYPDTVFSCLNYNRSNRTDGWKTNIINFNLKLPRAYLISPLDDVTFVLQDIVWGLNSLFTVSTVQCKKMCSLKDLAYSLLMLIGFEKLQSRFSGCHLVGKLWRCGGPHMIRALISRLSPLGLSPGCGILYCILGQDTLLSQCLTVSPPRCINECQWA